MENSVIKKKKPQPNGGAWTPRVVYITYLEEAVAKTPPAAPAADEDEGAADAADEADEAGDAGAAPEPDPEEPDPVLTFCVTPQVGAPSFEPVETTSGPAWGNCRSTPSVVVQPPPAVPTLAMKMPGLVEYAAARRWKRLRFLEAPPVRVTAAQFMYISRLPIWLNQVQASTASPAGASAGMVKSRFDVPEVGQLPSMLLMTVKVLASSVDRAIWQLPPPWLAPPVMVMLPWAPTANEAVALPAAVPRRLW